MPGDRVQEGLRVVTLVHPGSRAASHVLICTQTQAAAIVDPRPENRVGIEEAIRGLRLRFELHTCPEAGQARDRLDALRSGIGLAPRAGPTYQADARSVRISPTGEVIEGSYVLSVNQRTIRVGLGQTGMPYTVMGEVPAPTSRADRIRLAFGAWHIELVAMFWADGLCIAYVVGNRVWFGGVLRAPGRPPERSDRVLPLQGAPWGDDVLLYPSWAPHGICVGTMKQERMVAAVEQPIRLQGTYRDQELDALAGVDGLITPEPDDLFERRVHPKRRGPDSEPPPNSAPA